MSDLTNITTPIGLLRQLDPETAEALIAHGGPYECFGHCNEWTPKYHEGWYPNAVYRVAKPKPTPLIVHYWGALADHIVAVTRDEDGSVWMHDAKPYAGNKSWKVLNSGYIASGISTKIIDPGTCDWREAIAIRSRIENG